MLSRSLLLVGALLTAQAVVASDNISIRYLEPLDAKEAQALKEIQRSGVNDTMVALSERLMPFNKPLVIEYGSDDGPLYDPQKHVVQMPYTFYQEAWSYFKKNKYDEKYGKSAELGAIDTILHTLIHEAGHAYIADQNIPILGKEEDAVDNLAALLMIDYVENGDDAAISAADMFAFESGDKPDYYEFGEYIDEHSFDLQRYFSTLCLVYGSDPEKHKQLLDEVEKDYLTERKDFCIYQYQSVSQNWHHYLQSTSTDQ